jgi:hypothetical protein
MKYSLHSRVETEYLQKADEIRVDTRDYRSVPDLIDKYPDKDIVLELFHKTDIDWNELRRWGILSRGHLILCLDRPEDFPKATEIGVKYYLGYPVESFYEMRALVDNGVCCVNLGMPLIFDVNELVDFKKFHPVEFRYCPTVAYYDGLHREDGVCGGWIRPEDLEMYEPVLDRIEFNHIKTDKEQALYRIYAEQKEWPGDLGMIIENFNHIGVNRMIMREVTLSRMNCKHRCQTKGTCNICPRAVSLADPDRIKEWQSSEKITD